ncbi:MAG: hypothetical protein AABY22_29415 [Nanoarchaeota archaeon]
MKRKSIDEVAEIAQEVKAKYLSDGRYKDYIINVFPSYYTIPGKTDEDWCIRFKLRDKLPSYLPIVNSYKDIRILVEIKN